MFKFNFQNDSTVVSEDRDIMGTNGLEWTPAEEISLATCKTVKEPESWSVLNFNGYELDYIPPSQISSFIKNNKEILASDVIPAKYEGGLRIWDITHIMSNYLTSNESPVDFKNKSVLDLGCGNGLVGTLIAKLGASSIHFQDYNADVLTIATIPTFLKNYKDSSVSYKFFSGDWSSFSELNSHMYDVIVTNATIYSIATYDKLLSVFKSKLKKNGVILVGAKTYYFGYGGGTRQFEEALKTDGTFDSEVIWSGLEGVRHEILKVTFSNQ